jgi:hypothetical protein
MACQFELEKCAMPGNYACRKCKTCGHAVTTPAEIPESAVMAALESIKANCAHNKQVTAVGAESMTSDGADPTAALPNPFEAPAAAPGPGAYLKKYLSRIGITATPNCSCNAKARHMDEMGIEWCEANLTTIVGWLKEEAEKRRLPFFEWPAKMLVQKAIKSAKKAKEDQLAELAQKHQ